MELALNINRFLSYGIPLLLVMVIIIVGLIIMSYLAFRYRLLKVSIGEQEVQLVKKNEQIEKQEKQIQKRTQELHQSLQDSQEKAQEIVRINQVALAVNATLNLDEIMEKVIAVIQGIFSFNQTGIILFNKQAQELRFFKGYGDATQKQRRDWGQICLSLQDDRNSWFVMAFSNNKSYHISLVTKELLEYFDPVDRKIYDIYPPVAFAVFPLHIQEQPVGLIYFGNTRESFVLTDNDNIKIQRYLAQVATAIQNAQLYEKSQKQKMEIEEQKEKFESISAKLSKYLSPQVYESIFSGKHDADLQPVRKELTVFFSDIKGFTEMTDRVESEVLSELLNHYLDEMASIALRHGGTIDKFIGDAVMIFFGDPETKGDREDALACVNMAIEMQNGVKRLQQHWEKRGLESIFQVRIGINTGYCTVGNFGSQDRLDYTILGGQVNLASRLESSAEPGEIQISHATYSLIKDEILCEKKAEIKVKGIAYPVQTYQVIGLRKNIFQQNVDSSKEIPGFSASLDVFKIPPSEREQTLALLEDSLKKLHKHREVL